MFAALLDTCVLWPSKQRDFLLRLAVENLYRPLWSSEILEELYECELDKLTEKEGLTEAEAKTRADRLIANMRTHFDDAEVQNWQPYVGTFELPDPNDEHVLAAAVAGHAGAIVTSNLRDFPADKIPPGIQIVTPSDFAANTVAVAPDVALGVVASISAGFSRPPMSVDDLLSILRDRYGMHEAVDLMNEAR
ncbi:PIN domain-containing protein [Kribbella capetownensis]|uniref:PIN domain-containing protein n=1 Tax=Kribbella capetownensis TaxID=1572659 RepID=A0A4R0K1U3_9ACTN|nr:PIN domain-containing protein [Kribbella capetownensis]TCC53459.1 PIN domain-containing protein [Kribbella capetownensis]